MESRTIDLDGPLHYVEWPALDAAADEPPMLLVHGLGGSHVNWSPVGPAFARKRRVLALDLAGFGRTPLGRRRYTLDANRALIEAFVDRVVGAPVVLVGNSMGGLLSLMVASHAPERVRALVLVNAAHPPAAGAPLDREVALAFAMYMVPRLGEWVLRSRQRSMSSEGLVRETMRMCAARPEALAPEVVAEHVAIAEERRAMAWAHEAFLGSARSIVRTLLAPGRVAAMARKVRAPTLLVHGDRDRLVPLGAARAAATRHHWDLEVLHGVGHVPQLEVPERFVELVEAWLATT